MEHDQDNNGEADAAVDYVYDMFNRRIETITDSNGDGTPNAYEFYIYDGDNIAMDFLDADGPIRTENGSTVGTASIALENRYLWGFNVDELLAQDHYTSSTANGTYWTIQDRQNSIRDAVGGDLIIYNWHSTSYTDFGAAVAVSGRTFNNTLPSYFRFTYTSQERETLAVFLGMIDYNWRWYDTATATFITQDPAKDGANLYRYCNNDPINNIDPTGLYIVVKNEYADALDKYLRQQGFSPDSSSKMGYVQIPDPKRSGYCRFHNDRKNTLSDAKEWTNQLRKEIISGLLTPIDQREFLFEGNSGTEVTNKLDTHIKERESIANTAKASKIRFGVGEDQNWNSQYWDSNLDAIRLASESVLDVVNGNFHYVLACQDAIRLLMLGGILNAHKGDTEYLKKFDKNMGKDPIGNTWGYLNMQDDVPWYNWIPGERGYITNKHYKGEGGGLQGHNMIFVGAGLFSDAYGRTSTLDQSIREVWRWEHGADPLLGIRPLKQNWLEKSRRYPPID